MEFEDFNIKKVRTTESKSKILSIRITKKDFEWLRKNRISATKLFNYALRKIMREENNEKKKEKIRG